MADRAEIIIGIDLGTTNSLVAFCDEKGPRIIADAKGRRMLPSVVRYNPATGQVETIGYEARTTASLHPRETIFSIKRLMGRGIDDIRADLEYLPCKVVEGPQKTARVQIGNRVISPQEVSAVILRQLKQTAEAHFGKPVRKAVVTVPAYFDDGQRQATRDAGRLAGLDVVRIVNEPTAASLAYNLGLRVGKDDVGKVDETKPRALTPTPSHGERGKEANDATVAVYDLGGGTFDVSILRLHHQDDPAQATQGAVDQVLATAGDTHLGGDDVDRMLMELVESEIRAQYGAGIAFPPATLQALRTLAEETKIRLSSQNSAVIELDLGNDRLFKRAIERAELEQLIEPWVQKTIDSCKRALRAAELDVNAIERVVMVGGSTRIPLVLQRVREFFGLEPYTALNPDEVVALGAAVQASILMGVNRGLLLLDVIPLSLGIETMGGAVAKLIPANTTIPARATEFFSTYVDGQTNVKIHVLQGERELVKDCRSLGQFDLRGIPPMPAGLPKIEVAFQVDANGILSVSAIERRSEKSASIQIVPNYGLTRDEVRQIEAESLSHAKEDMTAHRLIDLRLHAQKDIRDIERQLAKVGDQLELDYRGQIEAKIATVRGFLAATSPDADAFAKALTEMDHATIRLAEIAIKTALQAEGSGHDERSTQNVK